jgi:hypothetical protein
MRLFRKSRFDAPLLTAFIGGGVISLGVAAFFVQRWIRSQPTIGQDEEITDFSDPYIPAPARAGSRRAVHQMV